MIAHWASLLLSCQMIAQEVLWQRVPSPAADGLGAAYGFDDVNGDGARDVMVKTVVGYATANQHYEVQFWSGRDGAMLDAHILPFGEFVPYIWPVGDVDGDGKSDFAITSRTPPTSINPDIVTIWSRNPSYPIWSASMPPGNGFGWAVGAGLDVDGDGRNEVIVLAMAPNHNRVYVFNSNGTQRYVLNANQFNVRIWSTAAVGDIDGDGGADFIVGCQESTGRGVVILVSGRTGAILRLHFGLAYPDYLGESTAAAGDVDRDGVPDYVAGSYTVNPRGLVMLFSGATGVPLHTWTQGYGGSLVGGLDVDLDGVLDVVTGSPGYYNGPNSYGRVQAFSGRDGQFLWEKHEAYGYTNMAWNMSGLGVQTGNPYPVFVYDEPGYSTAGIGRITAIRANLLGAGPVVGPGCGAAGIPSIGVRQQGSGSRITVSGGPPGALAWIALAPATQTSFGGITVPLPLDPFGLTGCSLLVPPVTVGTRSLGTTGLAAGYAFADLPVPITVSGTRMAAQWLAIDPLTGAFAMSARHEFRL